LVAGLGCGSKSSGSAGKGGSGGATGTAGTGGSGGASGTAGAGGTAGMDAGSDIPVVTTPLEHVTSVFPANGAASACTDAPLRLNFDIAPMTGAGGSVRVFDAANPATPVDSFDIAAGTPMQTIGPRTYYYKPIIITGNEAYIYLRRVLQPGHTYYVNIDPGVFTNGFNGPAIGAVADDTTWRFTVRSTTLAAGAAQIAVAADASGDFCTVQGAVDYIPAMNTTPVTINVATGTYREIVAIYQKSNITLHGADRAASVISYPNSMSVQNPSGGTAMGTKWRAMVGIDMSNDLVIENITLWNPSPQLSSNGQSETLRSEGGNRIILRNANFKGLQDTLLLTGQVYVTNSYVEGNVDFIWGNGVVYFDNCEIKDVGKKGYNVQARNPGGTFGYVFVDSKLTADAGLTGHYLARTDKNTMVPGSQVAYINCTLGPHIDPLGWLIDGYPRATIDAGTPDGGTDGGADGGVTWNLANLRFGEYKSVDPSGAPIDVSGRIPEAKQLSDSEAAQLRDVTTLFGGCNPKAVAADAATD
jgi:pectin methylesterase-like acyl-CoA thioesterase